jgi:hypothetical protein
MAVKFGRNYLLSIQLRDKSTLLLTVPLTLEFDVTRNILSSSNKATFRMYNLSQTHRTQIRRDQYNWGTFQKVSLNAGYGLNNLPVIFNGNISQAWSVRDGTSYITQIECYDGGFDHVNGRTNLSFPKGTSREVIIKSMIESLPQAVTGAIGKYTGDATTRGNAYSGNTIDVLRDLSGGGFFIDNGKAHALQDNECLQGEIQTIDSSSGLLGTPVLSETFLSLDILFEPRMLIGQKVTVNSTTADQVTIAPARGVKLAIQGFNGDYKVIGVSHKGTISGSVCGDARTSLQLTRGIGGLSVVDE